jgi:hypothetical protein
MKLLLILIAIAAVAYVVYDRRQGAFNPEVIETPVYAEIRMGTRVQGRDIDMVLFGEMASTEDCQERSNRVWQKLIDGCKECTMTLSSCKADLEPRNRRLFDDAQIHSTYLSFKRGNRFERNARMVVYGLTGEEGNVVCQTIKNDFQTRYEGTVSCVVGRGS